MKNLHLVLAGIVVASSAAFAGSGDYTATLAQPLTAKKEIIANGNIWRCIGATCVLTSQPEGANSVRSCHALQRQAGDLTAYVAAGKPYDPDKIAMCNSKG